MKIGILGRGKISRLVEDILPPTVEPVFYDDAVEGLQGLGGCMEQDLVIAIGDNRVRAELFTRYFDRRIATLIGATAVVSPRASVGTGSILSHGVVVHSGARLGRGTFIYSNSVIDVDVQLGDFCRLGPHVYLGRGVRIGSNCVIDAGARIIEGVTIGDNVHIAAGSLVTRGFGSGEMIVGSPARSIRGQHEHGA